MNFPPTSQPLPDPAIAAARSILAEWSVGILSTACDETTEFDPAAEVDIANLIRLAYASTPGPDRIQYNIDLLVRSFNRDVSEQADRLKTENRRLQSELDALKGRFDELHDQRFAEARQVDNLRAAITIHRDQHGDDRCWLDDQQLYAALGNGNLGDNTVGDPEAMLANCRRFIANRCKAGGDWKSYAELERENVELRARVAVLEPQCAKIG